MKVALLTLSISRRGGGVSDSVRHLGRELLDTRRVEPRVFSLADAYTAAEAPSWNPLAVRLCRRVGPASFGYGPDLSTDLSNLGPDVVHTHGLWTYFSVAAQSWSRRTRRPLMVTPHGMLDPWALNHSRWKKRVAASLFERRHLERAACLHALCAPEADAMRAFGLRNPVCVIPNGVDLPPRDFVPPLPPALAQATAGRKVLLYLGRIHPKKGLVNLIRAWAGARAMAQGWRLVIAGWDQGGHEQELRRMALALGLRDDVLFAGPLFGEAKGAAYHHADAFVLPSLSEGLPLVVLEAWSHRLPVLMTPACNLPEGFEAEAALRAEPESHDLARALEKIIQATDAQRRKMGENGRSLVEQKFTWPQCAAQMCAVYDWMVDGGPQPDCVSTC